MAKKPVEQPVDDEQETVEYENVEPVVADDGSELYQLKEDQPVITKPGGAAVSLDTSDERQYQVSFALPYGVLVWLLDPNHKDADFGNAINYGLNEDGEITVIGQLILAGFDQTAVRHKMLAAWREQHNRGVGGV